MMIIRNRSIYPNHDFAPYLDKVYHLHQNEDWAVDFLTTVDLNFIRIITDREYELRVIEGLSISKGIESNFLTIFNVLLVDKRMMKPGIGV